MKLNNENHYQLLLSKIKDENETSYKTKSTKTNSGECNKASYFNYICHMYLFLLSYFKFYYYYNVLLPSSL